MHVMNISKADAEAAMGQDSGSSAMATHSSRRSIEERHLFEGLIAHALRLSCKHTQISIVKTRRKTNPEKKTQVHQPHHSMRKLSFKSLNDGAKHMRQANL
jgi:hypothetical protein